MTPGAIPYLSRTVPYHQRQLATMFLFVPSACLALSRTCLVFADHGRSGVDGMSVLPFPVAGADSADHECSGVDGISLPTFPVTGADSADHGRSGVDGISLPTFPVTGADSPVQDYFEDDGISLPKYVFADASCDLFGN